MKHWQHVGVEPGRWVRRHGFELANGFFAAVLFGLGAFGVATLREVMLTSESAPVMMPFLILIGAVFFVAGVLVLLIRSGITVDLEAGEVVEWWGVLVPMKTKRFPLSSFRDIAVSRESRGSVQNMVIVHIVRLRGRQQVELGNYKQVSDALALGQHFAQVLGRPFIDEVSQAR